MGKRLDAVPTELTFPVVASGLEAAWVQLLGRRPSRDAVALLLAQSAFETGHWKKSSMPRCAAWRRTSAS